MEEGCDFKETLKVEPGIYFIPCSLDEGKRDSIYIKVFLDTTYVQFSKLADSTLSLEKKKIHISNELCYISFYDFIDWNGAKGYMSGYRYEDSEYYTISGVSSYNFVKVLP